MTRRTIQGVFEREDDLIRAAEAARRQGWRIVDIYTPYPMHETAHLLGLPRSRLPRAAFVFGALGIGIALWFQFWVSAFDWPLNVGGRPWNSLPAFVPVAFEMMVLFAGLGVVLTWLLVSRLYPGKKADLASPRVTDDCFVLEIQGPGSEADPEVIHRLFRECHASDWQETESP
jgi:hypothetical protein